jgi:hypothetical protein
VRVAVRSVQRRHFDEVVGEEQMKIVESKLADKEGQSKHPLILGIGTGARSVIKSL